MTEGAVYPVRARRNSFVFAAVLAMVLLPAVIAQACTATLAVGGADGAEPLPPEGPAAGTGLTVTGSDFLPGEVVLRWGSSSGPVLGEALADSGGGFSVEIVVPDEPGARQRIIAESTQATDTGAPSVAWADLAAPVAAAPGGGPATDGFGLPLAAVALLAAAAGTLAAVARFRRSRERKDDDVTGGGDLEQDYADLLAQQRDEEPVETVDA